MTGYSVTVTALVFMECIMETPDPKKCLKVDVFLKFVSDFSLASN